MKLAKIPTTPKKVNQKDHGILKVNADLNTLISMSSNVSEAKGVYTVDLKIKDSDTTESVKLTVMRILPVANVISAEIPEAGKCVVSFMLNPYPCFGAYDSTDQFCVTNCEFSSGCTNLMEVPKMAVKTKKSSKATTDIATVISNLDSADSNKRIDILAGLKVEELKAVIAHYAIPFEGEDENDMILAVDRFFEESEGIVKVTESIEAPEEVVESIEATEETVTPEVLPEEPEVAEGSIIEVTVSDEVSEVIGANAIGSLILGTLKTYAPFLKKADAKVLGSLAKVMSEITGEKVDAPVVKTPSKRQAKVKSPKASRVATPRADEVKLPDTCPDFIKAKQDSFKFELETKNHPPHYSGNIKNGKDVVNFIPEANGDWQVVLNYGSVDLYPEADGVYRFTVKDHPMVRSSNAKFSEVFDRHMAYIKTKYPSSVQW